MDIKNKDRNTLKSYFLKNKIPTESNFAELIDGMLNQKDDGIAKLPGDPLSIAAAGDGSTPQKLVHFYGNLADTSPAWLLQMNPRSDQSNPATAKAGFSISDGTGSSRLFIDKASGSLGIGTTAPSHKFHVVTADKSVGLLESTSTEAYLNFSTSEGRKNLVSIGNRPGGRLALWTAGGGYVLNITREGKVGIGTADPKFTLEVNGPTKLTGEVGIGADNPGGISLYVNNGGKTNSSLKLEHGGSNFIVRPLESGGKTSVIENTGGGALLINPKGGNVGIGKTSPTFNLDVAGDVIFSGRIGSKGYSPTPKKSDWGGGIHTWDIEAEGMIWSAKGMDTSPHDLAENYYSAQSLEAGEVVVLDGSCDGIARSSQPSDRRVLGVISTEPGLLLNAEHGEEPRNDGKQAYPLALCGRVPCKVTDENGPIEPGDFLASSSTPGYAMKAIPTYIGGIELYTPGTIIGKALEPFSSGAGKIEVFVLLR